ncbi:hypothetical protein ACOSQ2_007750 [Xanthoceras sorbifolium]
MLVVVCWRLWYRRSKFIHENQLLPASDIYAWSSSFVSDFDAANSGASGAAGPVGSMPRNGISFAFCSPTWTSLSLPAS